MSTGDHGPLNIPPVSHDAFERLVKDRVVLELKDRVDEVVKQPLEKMTKKLDILQKRLRWMFILTVVFGLLLALMCAALYGSLVNYWSGDAMFYGGTGLGAAILGFVAGWIARPNKG